MNIWVVSHWMTTWECDTGKLFRKRSSRMCICSNVRSGPNGTLDPVITTFPDLLDEFCGHMRADSLSRDREAYWLIVRGRAVLDLLRDRRSMSWRVKV